MATGAGSPALKDKRFVVGKTGLLRISLRIHHQESALLLGQVCLPTRTRIGARRLLDSPVITWTGTRSATLGDLLGYARSYFTSRKCMKLFAIRAAFWAHRARQAHRLSLGELS